MARGSLAIAIEALSWMAYTGIGERTALLKASEQMSITEGSALREAHKWIMETSRFQNRLDWFISQTIPSETLVKAPHGIRSLFRVIMYVKLVQLKPLAELERIVGWARQTIGWKEMRAYEGALARLVSKRYDAGSIVRLPEMDRLALETCHPTWYVERVILTFGRPTALRILERDLSPVSTFARLNDLKTEGDQIESELQASRVQNIDGVFILDKTIKSNVRGQFASSGRIVIQDLGSIVAGLIASPKPGQEVLDVCASPGNKTSHLGAQMRNEGKIYSIELSPTRSRQWSKEMARTGCSIAELIRADAVNLPVRGQLDVALVDPPCSNSGVFARNPASKWRITSARVRDLAKSQGKILQAASEHVVEGGTLVYCTCSVLSEENEVIVETFLKKHSQFRLIPHRPFLGSPGLRGLAECQRFYPHLHDCNGYFIAKMRKG